MSAFLSEELFGALSNWEKAHDTLLRLYHAALPLGQRDAERLREAAYDVKDQGESLGLVSRRALFFVVFLISRLLALVLFVPIAVNRASDVAGRALERPEEERRQPRILLDGAAASLRAIASAVPRTWASALRPTTSQTFSRYSASSILCPSADSTLE